MCLQSVMRDFLQLKFRARCHNRVIDCESFEWEIKIEVEVANREDSAKQLDRCSDGQHSEKINVLKQHNWAHQAPVMNWLIGLHGKLLLISQAAATTAVKPTILQHMNNIESDSNGKWISANYVGLRRKKKMMIEVKRTGGRKCYNISLTNKQQSTHNQANVNKIAKHQSSHKWLSRIGSAKLRAWVLSRGAELIADDPESVSMIWFAITGNLSCRLETWLKFPGCKWAQNSADYFFLSRIDFPYLLDSRTSWDSISSMTQSPIAVSLPHKLKRDRLQPTLLGRFCAFEFILRVCSIKPSRSTL